MTQAISHKKKTYLQIAALLFYRIFLEVVFVQIELKYYNRSSLGIVLDGMDPLKEVISWIIALCTIPAIAKLYKSCRISDIAIMAFLLLNFIPGTVFFVYYEMPFFGLFVFYYFMLVLANFSIPYKKIKFKFGVNPDLLCKAVLLVCNMIPLYIWGRYAHFRIHLDLFSGIYALRAEASQYVMPTVLLYSYRMVQRILPVLGVYFLSVKRKGYFYASMFGVITIFFVSGARVALFTVIAMSGVYWITSYINSISSIMSLGAGAVCLISYLENLIFKTHFICGLLVERLLFLPNILNFLYYQFFSEHGFDFFRSGFLSHFGFEATFGASLPKVIGAAYYGNYYGNQVTNANNGLFSEAYANLGVVGLVVLPILVVLLLRLFDSSTYGLSRRLKASLAVIIVIQLQSDSLFTSLLTGGFLLMIVLLMILPRKNQADSMGKKTGRRKSITIGKKKLFCVRI